LAKETVTPKKKEEATDEAKEKEKEEEEDEEIGNDVNGSKELLELLKKEFGNEATEVKEFYDLCHEKYPLSSYFSPPVSLAEIMEELNRGMEGREAPKQEEKKRS